MKGIAKGFTAFFSAFGFVFSNGLVLWYLVPIVLYLILVVVLAFSLASWLSPIITDLLNDWLGLQMESTEKGFWDKAKGLLTAGLGFAVSIAMKILIGYLLGRVMKYVILIITSPLLAYLSEKTEELRTGKTYAFSLIQLLKDALRGILISLRNLFLELILMGFGILISFMVPVLAPFITAALFCVNCYFMGFSMFDYVVERRKMGLRESVRYMRSNAGTVFGLGLAFNIVSFIPFADWVIAPVNGSVGAVLADESLNLQTSSVLTKA